MLLKRRGEGCKGPAACGYGAGQGWSAQALSLITVLPSYSSLLLAISCVSVLTPGCVGGESYNHGTT